MMKTFFLTVSGPKKTKEDAENKIKSLVLKTLTHVISVAYADQVIQNQMQLLSFNFSLGLQSQLRRYIKYERQRSTTFPYNVKFVKNICLSVVFTTLFSVFGNAVRHGHNVLI